MTRRDVTVTRRSQHICSPGCGCRSWRCTECGTAGLVDRQTRWETEQAAPDQFAPELCVVCGAPLCDTCAAGNLHTCQPLEPVS